MKKSKKFLVGAAVSGILSVGLVSAVSAASNSKEMGKCMGANSCKGKSACGANKCKSGNGCGGKNGCAGPNGCGGKKNACKGQGFIMTTKAKCDKMAKKNNKIYFVPNSDSAAATPAPVTEEAVDAADATSASANLNENVPAVETDVEAREVDQAANN